MKKRTLHYPDALVTVETPRTPHMKDKETRVGKLTYNGLNLYDQHLFHFTEEIEDKEENKEENPNPREYEYRGYGLDGDRAVIFGPPQWNDVHWYPDYHIRVRRHKLSGNVRININIPKLVQKELTHRIIRRIVDKFECVLYNIKEEAQAEKKENPVKKQKK